jgi:DNA (cytosine-5)-methyltransferase 1
VIFGTVCSGIGAPEAAWKVLGWRCAFMSEIEPFPRAVLAHHYPGVPLHGDFTTIKAGDYAGIDLLCGGTPCQSFSVAGLRGGLADERGNLALEFLRLAGRLRPRWVVWENVPGVRSSGGGRDFGAFLGGLGELGYGWAYRSLDAQYAGLAQRRERVFVVGYLGDWRPAAAVLFEPASLRGGTAPRRETGEGVARPIAAGAPGGSGYRNDADTADSLIAGTLNANGKAAGSATQQDAGSGMLIPTVSPALKARDYKGPSSDGDGDGDGAPLIVAHAIQAGALRENPNSGPDGVGVSRELAYTLEARAEVQAIAHTLRAEGFDASEDGTGRGVPLVAASLTSGKGNGGNPAGRRQEDDTNLVAFDLTQITSAANRTRVEPGLPASTLAKGSRMHAASMAAVRRLTPTECERLMGFSDGYSLVPYRKGMAADGPRYRALGNSMAVPVVRWIGQRIGVVDASLAEARHAA